MQNFAVFCRLFSAYMYFLKTGGKYAVNLLWLKSTSCFQILQPRAKQAARKQARVSLYFNKTRAKHAQNVFPRVSEKHAQNTRKLRAHLSCACFARVFRVFSACFPPLSSKHSQNTRKLHLSCACFARFVRLFEKPRKQAQNRRHFFRLFPCFKIRCIIS